MTKQTQESTAENNIASHLPKMAESQPDTTAILFWTGKDYESWSYERLKKTVDSYAWVLKNAGVKPGDKALLMLTAGPELIATAFALFTMGVQPVLLDPGMGKDKMLGCIRHVKPDVFIGIRLAQAARWFYSHSFKSVRLSFTATQWFPGTIALAKEAVKYSEPYPMYAVAPHDTAAILFTSGSTGPAKGVVYEHSIFQAQVSALKALFKFKPGEIDMPGYPLFGLFDVALGMTSLIPRLDPSKPAACDAGVLIDTINKFDVTTSQGSPAIWARVATMCKEEGCELPSLRRIITFGCPIPVDLLKLMKSVLPEKAEVYTPYGATESLPVALISGSEILEKTAELTEAGAGTCVGMPVSHMQVKIVKITDEPIKAMDDSVILKQGEIGEIAVHGTVVTQEYIDEPEANALAKIPGEDGRCWHRMGDTGYFDEHGRLWFCGRKAHRIETEHGTIFPVQAEGMANNHPNVVRTALVGVGAPGHQTPVLIVEPKDAAMPEDEKKETLFATQMTARYVDHPLFSCIQTVLFKKGFPVDTRHNVKIHREELAEWAKTQL